MIGKSTLIKHLAQPPFYDIIFNVDLYKFEVIRLYTPEIQNGWDN